MTAYAYDAMDRRIQVTDALGNTIQYRYDPAGNRTALVTPQATGGPNLSLSTLSVYWASYQDWLDHELSIDYRISDSGPGTAYESKVTHSTTTNGVYLTTAMPLPPGDINEGSSSDFTLRYYIPSCVLTGDRRPGVEINHVSAGGAPGYSIRCQHRRQREKTVEQAGRQG